MRMIENILRVQIIILLLLLIIPCELWAGEKKRGRVTIDVRCISAEELLLQIGDQAGVSFSYESSLLNGIDSITFQARNERLRKSLRRLLDPLDISFIIRGNMVILKAKLRRIGRSAIIDESLNTDSLIEADRLGEVVVTASDIDRSIVSGTSMGSISLSQRMVKTAPAILGEADILKTLQLTPGVASGNEGMSGMYVRGGDLDGNLFQIDGSPLYHVSHIGGLFSAFNPEVIRGVELMKAGFPARYGGRLSSVVDISTKEGNMREFHGSATIGLISGNLAVEGPIIKERTSFQLALRRSWVDLLSAPAMAIFNRMQKSDGARTTFRYAFHDINLKINHRLDDRGGLFFSLYNGNDFMKAGYREFPEVGSDLIFNDGFLSKLRWGTVMATLGWTRAFNDRLFGKVTANVSRYGSKIKLRKESSVGDDLTDDCSEIFIDRNNYTSILDMCLRSLFYYRPNASHHIRFGADLISHRFRPELTKSRRSRDDELYQQGNSMLYTNDLLWGHESSLFIEDEWSLSRRFSINAGLRLSLFHVDGKSYCMLEPRLSARWSPIGSLAVKGSYTRMAQYVHMLESSYASLPTDAWMPVTRKLKPLRSDQLSLGIYQELPAGYDLSVEGYYKWMDNLLDYKDGYTFMPGASNWEECLSRGEGRAYGVELMARKRMGAFTGWVSYALSWSDRCFDDIDNGRRFPAKYDNRHRLNIVATHKLYERVELTAAWSFSSGNWMTLSLENYMQAPSINNGDEITDWRDYFYENDIHYYTKRNNYKLPSCHRLDLGINIYRPKRNGRMGIWSISIYNVYCRMNPYMVYKDYTFHKVNQIDQGNLMTSTLPTFKSIGVMPIIPSISYTYKF